MTVNTGLSVTTPLIVRVALPKFSRLSAIVLVLPTFVVGNVSGFGERNTAGAAPFAVIDTLCGLFGALSVMVKVPVWFSVVLGVKVTVIVHVPLTARVLGLVGQLLEWEKSELTVPVMPRVVMLSGAAPVFFSVTGC